MDAPMARPARTRGWLRTAGPPNTTRVAREAHGWARATTSRPRTDTAAAAV
jgi:hypothetical protein